MAKIKLPYVQEFVLRGKVRRYFRRGKWRVRLEGTPGSKRFMEQYQRALEMYAPEPEPEPTKECTVAHAAAILVTTLRWSQLAESTRKVMTITLGHVVAAHGHRPMTTLTRAAIIAIRDSMRDRPGAARNWIEVIRKLCRVAIDQGWRDDDPSADVRVEYKSTPHKTWTWGDVQRFIDHHKGGRSVLALMLLLALGQRRGDVTRMSWRDVHNGKIRVEQGKTGAVLWLPIRPELMALIDPLPRDAPAFLMTALGRPFTPASFGGWFRDCCDAAGLHDLSAHGLRRKAMTAAADAGATAHELMALSGHRTMGMVTHYTREADQQRLAERAGAFPLPIRMGDKDED